jgi:putative spermidine/putrescine transport system substrate-binding protein
MPAIKHLLLLGLAPLAMAEPTLTIATWGGAYESVQREVLFDPFTEQTGIPIVTQAYNGGLAVLDDSPPDLIDMSMVETVSACETGRLQTLDHSTLVDGSDGTPARQDFAPGSLQPCSVAHSVYATVIAYDTRAFPGLRPSGVADLFNLEDFPGPRALQDSPYANLEWALLSYDVPRQNLYDLLSTQRGLQLAFERLDSLADQVFWWQAGQTPVDWLESGKVVMASGYNGRFFNARLDTNSPIEIIWDGQVQERQTWVIPQRADHSDAARDFIQFATTTERMAAIANHIAYGPTRNSAHALIGRHPSSGFDMRPHIPTHPYNASTAIRKDVLWYAQTYRRILQRFTDWRNGGMAN